MSEGLISLPLHTFKCIFYLLPLSRAGLCVIYAQRKAVNLVYAYEITAPAAVRTYYLVKQLQGKTGPGYISLKDWLLVQQACLPGISNGVHSLPPHHNLKLNNDKAGQEQ